MTQFEVFLLAIAEHYDQNRQLIIFMCVWLKM